MCQAVPAKVIELLDNDMAKVQMGSVTKTISLSLLEDVKKGEYVIVHVGFALNRLDEQEAMRTLEFFHEIYGDNGIHGDLGDKGEL